MDLAAWLVVVKLAVLLVVGMGVLRLTVHERLLVVVAAVVGAVVVAVVGAVLRRVALKPGAILALVLRVECLVLIDFLVFKVRRQLVLVVVDVLGCTCAMRPNTLKQRTSNRYTKRSSSGSRSSAS